ncbi:MAG: hypothetical protein WC659_01935 [Patescibacteria group bacterium]
MEHLNTIEESSPHERETEELARVEIMQTPHFQEALSHIQGLAARVDTNQAVTEGQMARLEHLVSLLLLDRGDGQGATFSELLKIKGFKDTVQTLQMFKQKIKQDGALRSGGFEVDKLSKKLTFIDRSTVFYLNDNHGMYSEDIDLSGLTSLDEGAASAFHFHEGAIKLDSITSIKPEVVEILVKRNRGVIFLNGLTSISPELARALTKSTTGVRLFGVTDISAEAAMEFVSQPHDRHGGVYFPETLFSQLNDEVKQILTSVPEHQRFCHFG